MTRISPTLPTLGELSATEDPKLRATLVSIVNTLNGNLDATNIADSFVAGFAGWTVNIDPFLTPATQTNWNTINTDSGTVELARLQSSGAKNDAIGWDIMFAAGTWNLSLIYKETSNQGIATFTLDNGVIGTRDMRNAVTTDNKVFDLPFTVSTSGKKRFTITMTGTSDTGFSVTPTSYGGNLRGLSFRKIS